MKSMSRRKFLQGCCAGIAAMSGAQLGGLAFAAPGDPTRDTVVTIFLRGGMDSLSFLSPYSDANYHTARAVLGLESQHVIDINGQFGLHLAAARLKELMDAGHLGIVMACGSPDATRSHFEAQDYMEMGIAGQKSFAGGWLARYLAMFPNDAIFTGVTIGESIDVSLEGFSGAIAMDGANGFSLQGDWDQKDDLRRSLRKMYASDPLLSGVAGATLDAIDIIDRNDPDNYTPSNGVTYPNTDLADTLQSVAQMIKLDLGLKAATVNYGGWDTHESQADGNPSTGYFAGQVGTLSNALHAFWTDMASNHGRLTVVVMSEFGRRLKENNNRGTDHGHAGIMLVLSSNLQRGGLFGSWPGLANEQLFENVDLQVTTDFRRVLAEVLIERSSVAHSNLAQVFPNYAYPGPLGLFPQRAGVSSETWHGFMRAG